MLAAEFESIEERRKIENTQSIRNPSLIHNLPGVLLSLPVRPVYPFGNTKYKSSHSRGLWWAVVAVRNQRFHFLASLSQWTKFCHFRLSPTALALVFTRACAKHGDMQGTNGRCQTLTDRPLFIIDILNSNCQPKNTGGRSSTLVGTWNH